MPFYADNYICRPNIFPLCQNPHTRHTVQELVSRGIIRRSMLLLKNSSKPVQEIADIFHFPNTSAFGTFFKKEARPSPLHYRYAEENTVV